MIIARDAFNNGFSEQISCSSTLVPFCYALVLHDLAATKSAAVPAGSKQGTQAAEEEQ